MDFGNDFYTNVCLIVFTFLFVLVFSYLVWMRERKSIWITDYEKIVKKHNAALTSAAWRVIIYLASCPLLIMLYIGAITLVSVKHTWNFSLSLTLVVVNLSYLIWVVALPLWNLLSTTVRLGAAEINISVKDGYPLEYYESKPGHLKK
jgi:hypothetical protein